MANIMDYLKWRGDLNMLSVPFCDVDMLILSRMSYIPFDDIVASVPLDEGITLKAAALKVLEKKEASQDKFFFALEEDEELLNALIESERFSSLILTAYANIFSEHYEEQFSAVTVLLPDETCALCFRGTDGTLVGWKEDFNMALSDCVLAQKDAAVYTDAVYKALKRDMRLGGHSKGGNLAVYSAAFCERRTQNHILEVRNFDGPGFNANLINDEKFRRALSFTHTILPNSSVIGMLLEHEEDFSIVQSTSVSILQHNLYTWEVMRGEFVTVEELTNSSRFIDATLKEWVAHMEPEKREKMINGIYSVFAASDTEQIHSLFSGKNTFAMLKAANDMDDETKEVISEMTKILKSAAKDSLGTYVSDYLSKMPFTDKIKKDKTRYASTEGR